LLLGDDYVLGYPFGPSINGQDGYRVHIEGLLEAAPLGSGSGLTAHYVDDWTDYHILLGGLFSGTNIDGPPPEDPWWTVPVP
jgi:protein-arginine deiminase